MLVKDRVAPFVGVEETSNRPKKRPRTMNKRVMARTGVASICTQPVAYSVQGKAGMRNHPIPGARIRCMVVTKFRPVRIEEKPRTKTPSTAMETAGVRMLYGA